MTYKKILIVGSGGREHAILQTILRTSLSEIDKTEIYVAPGNGGISKQAKTVDISPTDINKLCKFAKEKEIDLTIASMDDSLAEGIVDVFNKNNLRIFGPTKEQAQLESSKSFAKQYMKKYNIPTPEYKEFGDYDSARTYAKTAPYPLVIKADGLALGKGVVIANNFDDAKKSLSEIMVKKIFGNSGNKVIIEEYLQGSEISILAFTDGKRIELMPSAKDHKKIFDGDKGPNTGGMGTFSPAIDYNSKLCEQIKKEIIAPTTKIIKELHYKGVLFFGIMITEKGPVVLEYNARFGDPEAQVVLPKLKSSLIHVIDECIDGNLKKVEWEQSKMICVMLASRGYPGEYKKGEVITGLENVDKKITIFHSGTKLQNNNYLTNGGRVLGVVGADDDLSLASKKVYENIKKIHFDGMQYRTDIMN